MHKKTKISSDQYFFVQNGVIIKNLNELISSLKDMSQDIYLHHANNEKNDFANWVRYVLQDETLANDMLKASSKVEVINALEKHKTPVEKKPQPIKTKPVNVEKKIKEPKKTPKKAIELPLDKINEIVSKEREIAKKEEKIKEIEDRIEKQLQSLKKGADTPSSQKEFTQGIFIGVLASAIIFLIYLKFFF